MASLTIEMARAKANGDKKVSGFKGAQRSLENVALEKGDRFTFPQSYDVYEQKIGENTVQYVWVEINGNAKKFFPSTFTKSRTIYNEDGTSTGERVHTLGTAADKYREFGTVEEGMKALAGKTVEVSDVQVVRTLRFGTSSVMNTQIPTIDIVEGQQCFAVLRVLRQGTL